MGNRGSRELKVANFEKGKVYLFTTPSSRCCPTISPFALKLETWLRLKQIPHEVVRTSKHSSQKGQIPFIEYNGQEYNESNLIISFLTKEFNVSEEPISEEMKGIGLCTSRVMDNQLAQSYFYYRYCERSKETVALLEFLSPAISKIFSTLAPMAIRSRMKQHGIGNNPPAEIYDIGCRDIQAVADLLGDKDFLLANSIITTADCYVFAHLAQIQYLPIDYPHQQYMQKQTPKLVDYLNRIKSEVWPDWDEICADNLQSR